MALFHETQLRRCDTRRRRREHERPCDRVIVQVRPSDFLTANDGPNFLRAARALSLHFPPIQRMAEGSERIEDLSDIPDADIARMKATIPDKRQRRMTYRESRRSATHCGGSELSEPPGVIAARP